MTSETGEKFHVIRDERSSRRKMMMMSGDEFLRKASVGDIFTWSDVSQVHRVRNGIYHRNHRLISLLTDFGRINPCYPDFHGSTRETIHYTGYGRRGDQKLDPSNQALHNAIGSGHAVPLFNKLAPGRWEFLGYWNVVDARYIFDEKQNRMLWKFTLKAAQ